MNSEMERGIFVKHFKNIPMADLEIVLVGFLIHLPLVCFFILFLRVLANVRPLLYGTSELGFCWKHVTFDSLKRKIQV